VQHPEHVIWLQPPPALHCPDSQVDPVGQTTQLPPPMPQAMEVSWSSVMQLPSAMQHPEHVEGPQRRIDTVGSQPAPRRQTESTQIGEYLIP